MKLYGSRRGIGFLVMFLVLLAPFGAIFSGIIPSASVIPKAYAQWAESPTTWMNVTGGNGALNWIFREGYYPSPFTVSIEVSGAADLFAWEFKLSWNASLVDFASANEGDFLSGGVPSTTDFYSEVFQDQVGLDYVLVNCTLLSGAGKSGSGAIATVDFDLDASATAGSTALNMYETKMLDSTQARISHGVTDGFVFMGDQNMYPLIYILPQTCVADPGEMFNVTVYIDNVESLQAWGFNLYWTNTLLEATNIVNHIFLEGPSFGVQGFDNGAQSRAYASQVLAGSQPGTYGGGPLATITFMVEAAGKSILDLYDTDLIGIYYNPPETPFTYLIDHAAFDGFFRSYQPIASFTYAPQPMADKAAINQTILFNATASQDPDFPPIVDYEWDFGDGNTTAEADPLINHAYTAVGSYTVNLTITNTEGRSGSYAKNANSGGPDVVLRDIVVTSVLVSHRAAMQNVFVNISVTFKNNGTSDEKNFHVEVYAQHLSTSVLLESRNIVSLGPPGSITSQMTEYFTWNTTGDELGDYTIQGIVPTLPGENYVNNNEMTVPIEVAPFNLVDYQSQIAGNVFHTLVESNSTLSYPSPFQPTTFQYNRTAMEISFNVTGPGGAFGYCNVTIRKSLLSSQPLDAWVILFDGIEVTDSTITENATHTFVYFTYALSEHRVQIIGTQTGTPPSAAFTVAPAAQYYFTKEILTFNAVGSTDLDGRITTYFFDFDDNSNATGTANYDGTGNLINITWTYREQGKTPSFFTTLTPEVGHNFTKMDELDFTFNVALNVTDDSGFTATVSVPVEVFDPYDMAITAITVRESTLNITEMASVNVTVINKLPLPATLTPKVNVTLYGNQTKLASGIFSAPYIIGTTLEAQFELNTTKIGLGLWTLNATAELVQYGNLFPPEFPSEPPSTLSDNKLSSGSITIKKYDSALTISVSSTSLAHGSQVIISGQLTPSIAGVAITLESKLGTAAFANLTTVSTKVGGQYQYLWAPAQAGTYEIRARFLGDAITSGNVSVTQTVVVRQISSIVSIEVTPSSISLGSSVSINGNIDPVRPGVLVTVYYRLNGGEWASLPATSTDAQGNYAVQWQPTEAGTYEVQAKWLGDANTAADDSDIKQVTVGGGGWAIDPIYIAAAAVVIIVAVAVFFFLRRKNA
jgi:PKD repeat protein